MKKILSLIILTAILLFCTGCGIFTERSELEKESALPSSTDEFTLTVGETKDGLFTCRGASAGAVVVSSDESVAQVISYEVIDIGSVAYKIKGLSKGEATILVKSGTEGIILDSHTYTVK